ncbi:MAG: M23 family metallopeptidase [Candidatus Eisenbacteria sp.]|nr:M23 family metallopeptidase [Candidatus Eisenbacteria bacterium]
MADKFITLMVISQPAAGVSTFRFRRKTLVVLGIFLVAFVGFSSFLAVSFAGEKVKRANLTSLEERNRILRDELASLGESLARQCSHMQDHVAIEERLRLLANLNPIPDEVRMMGVGGVETYPASYTRVLSSSEKRDLMSVGERTDQLLRQTRLQQESLKQIEQALVAGHEEWAHVPSIRPLDSGFVSSGFGRRIDPFTGRLGMHHGVDYCTWVGEPIHATADGIVVKSMKQATFGKIVVIDHGNGYTTKYAHNQENLVDKGQRVKRGDVIATVGNSGRSTGPHIHYEIRLDGKAVNPFNYVLSGEYIVD